MYLKLGRVKATRSGFKGTVSTILETRFILKGL